ncbi:fimbrial protein [Klebsiella pneumoniae]|uniref:fimbrial protein n=1 Tax=Klebsiella pneumoniae TaxID=573 RepID=UPI0025A09946|nr:type 1 fimbrial protein [Klebsiella pneumoniae]MDM7426974.1 type 1 fimbrial protein [Klebsiella pneumoniae]
MVMTYKVGISQRKICGGVELKYYCIFVRGVLMIPMILGAMVFLLSPVYALGQGKGDVEGSSGTLFVHGALTESACRLEMASAHQDVLLGEIGTGRLQKIGSRGEPVWIELYLEDCLRSPVIGRDKRTGALTWSEDQPAVTVSFRAMRDVDNPQLVKVEGVSGLGLRLVDAQGEDVRLGSKGKPLFLRPEQNTLSYAVIPERTLANLNSGSYMAVVDFNLSYE